MSGLILKLRPHEELMINGVLVENGDRNTRLCVKTGDAHILRVRDALKPHEVTTPLQRAYYVAQLAVSGQMPNKEAALILTDALNCTPELADHRDLLDTVANHEFYQVMRGLRADALPDRDLPKCAPAPNKPVATALRRTATG